MTTETDIGGQDERLRSAQSRPVTEPACEQAATEGAEVSAAFTAGPLVFGDSSMDDPSPGPKWEVYTPHKGSTAYCYRRADAQLYAAAPDLLQAATMSADKFDEYAVLHAQKGTEEGNAKARTNAYMAAKCRAAIAKALGASA